MIHQVPFLKDAPVPIASSPGLKRDLRLLDLSLPYEIHKIGVLYVGEGQHLESQFLSNSFGSPSYSLFLRGLGSFVRLKGCSEDIYTGGLDKKDESDGEYAVLWRDSITQVLFHVATMMPSAGQQGQNKKRHLGNDYVTIVFCDNSHGFSISSLSGQFHFIVIIIFPHSNNHFRIHIHRKTTTIPLIAPLISYVHAKNLSVRIRELAIIADLAVRGVTGGLQAENWIRRLTKIRQTVQRYSGKGTGSSEISGKKVEK